MTDPTSLPNFQPHVPAGPPNGAASETPVRDRILAALGDLGVEAKVDKDGDLEFSVNDQTLFARVAEGEIPLVRFFGQWQLQEPVSADRNEPVDLPLSNETISAIAEFKQKIRAGVNS